MSEWASNLPWPTPCQVGFTPASKSRLPFGILRASEGHWFWHKVNPKFKYRQENTESDHITKASKFGGAENPETEAVSFAASPSDPRMLSGIFVTGFSAFGKVESNPTERLITLLEAEAQKNTTEGGFNLLPLGIPELAALSNL